MSSSSLSLSLHAGGLIVIYSLYGVLQERIMKGTYGGQHFTSSSLLILCNRLFSIGVGLAILWYKSRSAGPGEFRRRLKPRSAVSAYAAVAVFNFLSTTCQYEALKYVSYTTQSLAKCAKMVPVLVVGYLVYKKSYKTKEWVAGTVILLGCGTYLFAQPPVSHKPQKQTDTSFVGGILGAAFLMGYLFFDGLVSTTQEKVFGKNPSSSDPFGPESPVLDQMIYTNFFACIIAFVSAIATNVTGSLLPNVQLLLTSPALIWDVCIFSGASALGLIVLLNTIASFGALTSSLVMTTRQFLSILINAGIFGNFGSVSLQGWTGVGWVASGIFIKMNRRFDPPKPPKSVTGTPGPAAMNKDYREGDAVDEELAALARELDGENGSPSLPGPGGMGGEREKSRDMVMKQHFQQYGVPILVPVLLAVFLNFLLVPVPPIPANTTTPTSLLDTTSLNSPSFDEDVQVSGGTWSSALHAAVNPKCAKVEEKETRVNPTKKRTGFVSYPRSGNSYLRGLVERTTGWQTSSIYCDKGLQRTFAGECDHKTTFFVKTHFPALPKKPIKNPEAYKKKYDQVVHLVRNPLDSISSWYHLSHAARTSEGFQDHEHREKLPGGKFGKKQRDEILWLATRWRDHADYWLESGVLRHEVRYEDLRSATVPKMMDLLTFLLPSEELPALEELACMVEEGTEIEAYKSRKSPAFSSWSTFQPSLRREVLDIVRRPFCQFGYDKLLESELGTAATKDMVGFCWKNVPFMDFVENAQGEDGEKGPEGAEMGLAVEEVGGEVVEELRESIEEAGLGVGEEEGAEMEDAVTGDDSEL